MERTSGVAGRAEAPGSVRASWEVEMDSAPRAGSAVNQPRALWFLALWHLIMVLMWVRCDAGNGAGGEEEVDVGAACAAAHVAGCGAVLGVKAAHVAEGGWEGMWRDKEHRGVSVYGALSAVVRCFCVISEESLTNCAGLWPQENPATLLVWIMFLQ